MHLCNFFAFMSWPLVLSVFAFLCLLYLNGPMKLLVSFVSGEGKTEYGEFAGNWADRSDGVSAQTDGYRPELLQVMASAEFGRGGQTLQMNGQLQLFEVRSGRQLWHSCPEHTERFPTPVTGHGNDVSDSVWPSYLYANDSLWEETSRQTNMLRVGLGQPKIEGRASRVSDHSASNSLQGRVQLQGQDVMYKTSIPGQAKPQIDVGAFQALAHRLYLNHIQCQANLLADLADE